MQLKLFNSIVSPIWYYGAEVWGLHKAEQIDKMHISFLKSILCVKVATPNCFVYGELGVYPLRIERQIRVVKYWLKVISTCLTNDNYVGKVYMELLELSREKPNITTWCTQVRDLLCSSGFGYVWANQRMYDGKEFMCIFRQRLYDIYLQEWNANVSLTSENRLYRSIKYTFKYEQYLNINNRSLRIALTRIRLSSHLFMIERGRWGKNRLHVNDRKCSLCGVLENEFHSIMVCPRFNNEREGCLAKLSIVEPNNYEFVNLFRNKDEEVILNLAILCYKIQKEYRQFV